MLKLTLLLLIAVFIVGVLKGCSTIPTQRYVLSTPITIYVQDKSDVMKNCDGLKNGCWYESIRTAYVKATGFYDINGNPLPDL